MLLAAQIGWNQSASAATHHDDGGDNVNELSGLLTTVNAADDPLFKLFPYDPNSGLKVN